MAIAKLTIGGTEVHIPELSFKALKKVFPIIKKMKNYKTEDLEDNPEAAFDSMTECLAIISIALERSETPMTVEELEDKLLQSELLGLQPAVASILSANGLVKAPGELKAGVEAAGTKPSTATSTRSSVKSSPDSEVQTGT